MLRQSASGSPHLSLCNVPWITQCWKTLSWVGLHKVSKGVELTQNLWGLIKTNSEGLIDEVQRLGWNI